MLVEQPVRYCMLNIVLCYLHSIFFNSFDYIIMFMPCYSKHLYIFVSVTSSALVIVLHNKSSRAEGVITIVYLSKITDKYWYQIVP